MDRYTSPETSRLLAEAGLEQQGAERMWCFACTNYGNRTHLKTYGTGIRALDLTDVLRELVRPRPEEKDARPLVRAYQIWYDTEDSNTPRFRYWDADGLCKPQIEHRVVVEAAALVLLALLRERKS